MTKKPTRQMPPDYQTLDDILDALKDKPVMSAAELRDQTISFVFGNVSIGNSHITREMVADEYDRTHGTLHDADRE